MTRRIIQKSMPVFMLALLCAAPVRADFSDGVVAYATGEYDKAFQIMQSLAETADHAYAQYYLGMMYLRGQGAEQDYESASQWFRKAAEQRIAPAQYKLGTLYSKGRGVPQDHEFAYVWFLTGAAFQHEKSQRAADKAKEKLSAEELQAADRLSKEFIAKYGPQEGDKSDQVRVPN